MARVYVPLSLQSLALALSQGHLKGDQQMDCNSKTLPYLTAAMSRATPNTINLRPELRKLAVIELDTNAIRRHNRRTLSCLFAPGESLDQLVTSISQYTILGGGKGLPLSKLVRRIYIYVPTLKERVSGDADMLRYVMDQGTSLGRPVYAFHDYDAFRSLDLGKADTALDKETMVKHYGHKSVPYTNWNIHSYRTLLSAIVKRNLKELLFSPVSEVRKLANHLRREARNPCLLEEDGKSLDAACRKIVDLSRTGTYSTSHQTQEVFALTQLCKEQGILLEHLPAHISAHIINELGREL